MNVFPSAPDDPRQQQSQARMSGMASNHGRVYQAAQNQIINETVLLPVEAVRPVTQVAAPPQLVNLPRRARTFVGREDELAALEEAFRGGSEVVVTALHGLGGVGKSTLAAHYALARATRTRSAGGAAGVLNPVWWITADSSQAVQAGLAQLTTALQPELATVLPLEALAERAKAWLSAHEGWLLVLDNVVNPDDVRPLLERTLAGQVLVTSRLGEGWHRLDAQVLRLDVLGEREAIELLARIATFHSNVTQAGPDGNMSVSMDGAVELARELGCLPLAIEQVGAYLRQARLTPRAYLALLQDQPAVMYRQAARGSDAERSIARIWRLTMDRLMDTPLTGLLLRVLAWFGAEPIARTVLNGLDAPASAVQHALSELAAYNMINLDRDTVTVHRLVQAVARTPDPDDPHRQAADIDIACDKATNLLITMLPDSGLHPDGWSAWRALLPHINALAHHVSPDSDTATTAFLLDQSGQFLLNQGDVPRAIARFERAISAYQQHLGADDSDTLDSRHRVAIAYQSAGNLEKAIALYEAVLTDCERVLDVDHPATLSLRNSLAGAFQSVGDLGRAIPLYRQTLAGHERVLDADHPSILQSRNNLAGAYVSAGRPRRAIAQYEALIPDCVRVLGSDHPATLSSRNNLAYAYHVAGDLLQAISLYEATLADCEQVLGADHPDTVSSRHNLAGAYHATKDFPRAIPLYEASLADFNRVHGADHPNTVICCNNLARAYEEAGDLGRAILLFRRAFANCERVLGADHPLTKGVRAHLSALG